MIRKELVDKFYQITIRDNGFQITGQLVEQLYTLDYGNYNMTIPSKAEFYRGTWYKGETDSKGTYYLLRGYKLRITSTTYVNRDPTRIHPIPLGEETEEVDVSSDAFVIIQNYNGAWYYRNKRGDFLLPNKESSSSVDNSNRPSIAAKSISVGDTLFNNKYLALVEPHIDPQTGQLGAYYPDYSVEKATTSLGYTILRPAGSNWNVIPFREPKTKKIGFVNRNGRVVVPAKYNGFRELNEMNCTAVRIEDRWGLVDINSGKEVLPCKYHDGNSQCIKVNDKWGYLTIVDKYSGERGVFDGINNKTLIPVRFSEIKYYVLSDKSVMFTCKLAPSITLDKEENEDSFEEEEQEEEMIIFREKSYLVKVPKKSVDNNTLDIIAEDRKIKRITGHQGVPVPMHLLDEKPSFNNGEFNDFKKWLLANLELPDSERKAAAGHILFFIVDINEDGNISYADIYIGFNDLIDKEFKRVLSSSPRWKPGRVFNTPVTTRINMSIDL